MANSNSNVQIDIDLSVASKGVEKSITKVSNAIQKCVNSATDLSSAINQTPERFYGVSRKLHSNLDFVKNGLEGLGASFNSSLQSLIKSTPYYSDLQNSIKNTETHIEKLSTRYQQLNDIMSSGHKPITDPVDAAAIKKLQGEIDALTEKVSEYTTVRDNLADSLRHEKSSLIAVKLAIQSEHQAQQKAQRALKAGAIGTRAYNKAIFDSQERITSLTKSLKSSQDYIKKNNARYNAYGINIKKVNSKISEHEQTIQNITSDYSLSDNELKQINNDIAQLSMRLNQLRGVVRDARTASPAQLLTDMFSTLSNPNDIVSNAAKVMDILKDTVDRIHNFENIINQTREAAFPSPSMGANATKFSNDVSKLVEKFNEIQSIIKVIQEHPEISTPQLDKKLDKDINDLLLKMLTLRNRFKDINAGEYSAFGDEMSNTLNAINNCIDALGVYKQIQDDVAEEDERVAHKQKLVDSIAHRLSNTWLYLKGVVSGSITAFKNIGKIWGTIVKTAAKLVGKFNSLAKSITKTNKHSSTSNITLKKLFRGLLQFGIGVRTLYYLIRKIRTEFISGFQELGNVVPSINSQIISFTSALNTLKGSFVTAFQPIVSYVIPVLNTLMNVLSNVMFTLAQFFATLTGQKVIYKAVANNAGAAADAVEGVGDAAGDAADEMKELAEYDNLLVIDDDTDSGSGSGSGGGSGSGSDAGYSFIEVDSATSKFADMVKNAWKQADFTEVGTYIGEALQKALLSIDWDKIKQGANNIGTSLATLINGFVKTELDGVSLGSTIGSTLGEAVNTGIELLKGFNSKINWKAISKFINDGISTFLTTADFAEAGEQINNFLGGALTTALDVTGNTSNWQSFKQKFVEFMDNLNLGELIGQQIKLASNIIRGIADSLYSYIILGQAYRDFSAVVSGIATAISTFQNSDIIKGAANIGKFILQCATSLVNNFGNIVGSLGNIAVKIIDGITVALDDEKLRKGLVNSICYAALQLAKNTSDIIDALVRLAVAIIDTIVDNFPEIVEGLKECIEAGGWKVIALVAGWKAITGIGGAIIKAIKLKLTANAFASAISGALGAGTATSTISNATSGAGSKIATGVSAAFTAGIEVIKSSISKIKEAIPGIKEALVAAAPTIGAAFGVAFVAAATGIITGAGISMAEASDPDVHKSDADVGRDRNITAPQDSFWATYASDMTYATSALTGLTATLKATDKVIEDNESKLNGYKSTVIHFAEQCGYSYDQLSTTLTATVKDSDGTTREITFNLNDLSASTVATFLTMQQAANDAGVTIPANIALGILTGKYSVEEASELLGIAVPENVATGVANKKSRKKVEKAVDDLADSIESDEYDDEFETAGESGVDALTTAIEDGESGVGDASDSLKQSITDNIEPVEDDMTSKGTNAGKNLNSALSKYNAQIKQTVVAIYKIITSAFDNLSSAMYTIGKNVGTKLNSGLNSTKAGINITMNTIKGFINLPDYSSHSYSVGYAIGSNINRGMNAWVDGIKNQYNNYIRYMKLPDYYDHSYNMGYYVGKGLYNGLNSWKGYIESLMKYICNSLTKTAKVTLQIASPSKIMRKLFGYAGEGMYLGLADYEDAIADEMNTITSYLTNSSVISGTKLPANKTFSALFNGNDDNNSTSIESLVKNIQDLIANQTTMQMPEKIQVTLPNGRVLAETVWSEQKKYYKQTGFTTPRFT